MSHSHFFCFAFQNSTLNLFKTQQHKMGIGTIFNWFNAFNLERMRDCDSVCDGFWINFQTQTEENR